MWSCSFYDCKGLLFSAFAEQHQKGISSLQLAPSSSQVLGQSLKNRGGMITLGQSPKSHLPITLTQKGRSWLSWTPLAVLCVVKRTPSTQCYRLSLPNPPLHFSTPSALRCSLPSSKTLPRPELKLWDTRISQKLSLYPLSFEKGTSPVERSPDNKKPLEGGGIYTYCPFCCASSVTHWSYRVK